MPPHLSYKSSRSYDRQKPKKSDVYIMVRTSVTPGGVLPNILGGGVPHGSQNPDPISDQNVWFFMPLFRPDPENLYPFQTFQTKKAKTIP